MKPVRETVPGGPGASWHLGRLHEPRFAFRWHYHPEVELTLITAGSGHRYVGDSVARYGPGDLVLIGEGLPHSWRSESAGPHRAVVCQFRRDFLGPHLFSAPELAPVAGLLDRATGGLAFEAGAVGGAVVEALPGLPTPRRTVELLRLLVDLAAAPARSLTAPSAARPGGPGTEDRLGAVLGFVAEHYAGQVSLARAAALVALTPDALGRWFRRRTGRTYTDHVNDVRCAAASRLLVSTDETITAIAAGCGYANLANFHRRFRERFGGSPREYRTGHRPPPR